MNLIMLPAFDGTGLMFNAFNTEVKDAVKTFVVAYPQEDAQDYLTLAEYVRSKIPENEDYILLGESFAGPLVYEIACKDPQNCKACIFVATYLTNPSPAALNKLTRLPAKLIVYLLSIPIIIAKLTLSKDADLDIAKAIADNFASVKPSIIKQRLKTINSLGEAPTRQLAMPCLNLTATEDKLVMKEKINEFKTLCTQLTLGTAEGGHFVLQENPIKCGEVVKNFLTTIYDAWIKSSLPFHAVFSR